MALLVCSTSVRQSTLSYFPTTTSISSQCTRYERYHTSQAGNCGIAMGDHGINSLEHTIPAVMRNSLSIHPFRICPVTFAVHTFDHLIFATQYLESQLWTLKDNSCAMGHLQPAVRDKLQDLIRNDASSSRSIQVWYESCRSTILGFGRPRFCLHIYGPYLLTHCQGADWPCNRGEENVHALVEADLHQSQQLLAI